MISPAWLAFSLLACSPIGEDLQVEPGEVEDADKADGSDGPRVELKITLASAAAARQELGLSDERAEQRQVSFYDSPDLALFTAGIVLRSRLSSAGDDDVTVKLRPLEPGAVDGRWFGVNGFKCETDRTPTASVESCSITVGSSPAAIAGVAARTATPDSLFSAGQLEFVSEHQTPPVALSTVLPLGPIETRVWKVTTGRLRAKLTVESWILPDGREVLEVSTKVPVEEGDAALAELEAWLGEHGLPGAETQETKTRTALEQLAARL